MTQVSLGLVKVTLLSDDVEGGTYKYQMLQLRLKPQILEIANGWLGHTIQCCNNFIRKIPKKTHQECYGSAQHDGPRGRESRPGQKRALGSWFLHDISLKTSFPISVWERLVRDRPSAQEVDD